MIENVVHYFMQCIIILFLYLVFTPQSWSFSDWHAILAIKILQKHNRTFFKECRGERYEHLWLVLSFPLTTKINTIIFI